MSKIGVAIVGCGKIALANHIPGFGFCPAAKVVALCDCDQSVLDQARQQTGIDRLYEDYHELTAQKDVHAVVIATPNHLHRPMVLAALAAGKHVLCEKPIAMNTAEAMEMYRAAEAAGVRHMTAFTYRFVPAMAYMSHLVKQGFIGRPYHFRAQRFQDWGSRPLGWRQVRSMAGSGEMGDMLSHRIDYGHLLVGRMKRVFGQVRRFIDERGGRVADVEDWVAAMGDFEGGATGVWESTKLASGRGEGGRSRDYCEVNGSEGSLVYDLGRPTELLVGKQGEPGLRAIEVPQTFLKHPASARDPKAGDVGVTFRYDQDAEFVDAIVNGRPCVPSFADGARVQAVMDAIERSNHEGKWVELEEIQ